MRRHDSGTPIIQDPKETCIDGQADRRGGGGVQGIVTHVVLSQTHLPATESSVHTPSDDEVIAHPRAVAEIGR